MAAPQQATAYTADGQPIAPEDTAAAVREGRGFFQKGSRVTARNPDGELVTIAGEDASLPGYQVLNPGEVTAAKLRRDAETAGGMAKTAGEGLVRGATMGLLGPEQFYDSEGRARAKARVEANPNLAMGSELAGAAGATIAASLLSGGAAAGVAGEGTAARLAAMAGRGALTPFRAAAAVGEAAEAATGASTLGRIAGLGLRGAAEGAMFGAGREVSQAALEDVPLTAERLLAGAWDGAKMGGAFGLGLGVLSQGVGKAGRAIVGRMAETGDDLGKATGSWAERTMARQHLDGANIWKKATNGGSDMARPARIGRKLLDADMPSETTAALRRADELAAEAASRLRQVATAADESGVLVQPQRILAAVDDQVSKLKETPFGDFQNLAKRVESEIAPFRTKFSPGGAANDTAPPMRFSELWDLRKKLDDVVYREGPKGPAKEALEEMRDAFRRELDTTIEEAAATSGAPPELLSTWKKATEDYSDFALVKQSLKDLSKRRSNNRSISPSDYGTGSAAGILMGILSGNPVTGLATSAVTSAAHKLIRERGAGVVAKIADRTGNVASQMEMAGKVAALVEAPKRLAAPVSVNVAQQFDHYSQALTQAQTDPVKFSEKMAEATADLALRAPELAQQIQQTMLADMAYLNQLHPAPTTRKNATLTPHAKLPEFYAYNQKQAFVDAAMALDNPMGVFEDIARGELPLTKIETLKERRPLLFGEMRQTVIKYTMTREEELPFSRRMLLGTAFDFPADWSMLHVSDIQEALTAPDPSGKPNDPTAAPSKVGSDPGANISPGQF